MPRRSSTMPWRTWSRDLVSISLLRTKGRTASPQDFFALPRSEVVRPRMCGRPSAIRTVSAICKSDLWIAHVS